MEDYLGSTTQVGRKVTDAPSRWDMKPLPGTVPNPSLVDLMQQRTAAKHVPKQVKECYFGNLAVNAVDKTVLEQAILALFQALPSYRFTYPDLQQPVTRMNFHRTSGQNFFAFVEFHDEVLASTAVKMNGFRLAGRDVVVGRPQGYSAAMEAPALDVEPLRQAGMIPPETGGGVSAQPRGNNKKCELFIGNLTMEYATEDIIREVFTPVCEQLPEYDRSVGPPITKVTIASNKTYCFVGFQSETLATRVIPIFDDTELFGRRIRVRRPSGLVEAGSQARLQTGLDGAGADLAAIPTPMRLRLAADVAGQNWAPYMPQQPGGALLGEEAPEGLPQAAAERVIPIAPGAPSQDEIVAGPVPAAQGVQL